MLCAQLVEEVFKLPLELASTISADDADLEARGGDAPGEHALKNRCGVALLQKPYDLEAVVVVDTQHRVAATGRRRFQEGSDRVDEESRSARIRARFCGLRHSKPSNSQFGAGPTWSLLASQVYAGHLSGFARDLLAGVRVSRVKT